jgi:aspartate kinase
LLSPRDYASFRGSLGENFDSLDDLLRGIHAVCELSPRTTDYVLSFGEVLSSALVNAGFAARGIPAALVDSRQCLVTDAQHTRAVPQFELTNPRMAERLAPLLEAGRVPVMGGFIAATADGITTTIGRGGSDFSAAIVGAAIDAQRIEIWTDVDGIKTTDPNLCPQARRLAEVSFDEAAEMAFFGAKVLHPATLLPAMQKNIPVYVLNSHNPSSRGTCVRTHARRAKGEITAISAKKNMTIINVRAGRMLVTHSFLHDVFEVFKRHQISVDTVSTSEVSVSMTVDSKLDLSRVLDDLRTFTDVETETGKAIVCVIGENLRGTHGMLAKVFGAITDVNVRMVSQGSSEINISFVIEEKDVPEAVRRLHHLFVEQMPRAEA